MLSWRVSRNPVLGRLVWEARPSKLHIVWQWNFTKTQFDTPTSFCWMLRHMRVSCSNKTTWVLAFSNFRRCKMTRESATLIWSTYRPCSRKLQSLTSLGAVLLMGQQFKDPIFVRNRAREATRRCSFCRIDIGQAHCEWGEVNWVSNFLPATFLLLFLIYENVL